MLDMFKAIFASIAAFFYSVENIALAAERITSDLIVDEDDLNGEKALAKLEAANKIKQQIRAARNPKATPKE